MSATSVAGALAALVLAGAVPQDAELADGEARLAAGDLRGAMIRFERAVRADPGDAVARRRLAEALLLLGEADRAEKMARAARRDAGTPEARDAAALVHAEALLALERFADAEDAAQAASAAPRRAGLLALARAERALARGEPEAALRLLPDAVRVPGLRSRAELVAARAQYARGDLVRARRLTERVLKSDADAFDALLLRARLALRAGDTGRAGTLADAILARDPGNVSAGAVGIEAALRRGETERARALHRELAPLDETDPRPAYLAALIALAEDQPRLAGDAIAGIEPWLESVEGGAVLIARVKAANGRLAQAERTLRARLRVAPRDAAARAQLIDVLDRSGKGDEADDLLAEGLASDPEDAGLVARRAERLMTAGRADEATRLLTARDPARASLTAALSGAGHAASAGVDAAPDARADTLLAAYAALRRGEGRGALAAARDAVAATERSAVALNLLAAAQAASGDEAAARRTLDEVIAADPDYLAAIANRAALTGSDRALLTGLRAAREAGATSAGVLTALATEAWVHGEADEALEAARAAVQAERQAEGQLEGDDGDPAARLLLARLQQLTGADPSATLDALLGDAASAPQAVLPAAALLEARGEAGRAAPVLERLARRNPDPRFALAAASARAAAGEGTAALRGLLAARRAAPTDPRLAARAIEIAAATGASEDAAARLSDDAVRDGALTPAQAEAARLAGLGRNDAAARALLAEADDPRSVARAVRLAREPETVEAATRAVAALADQRPGDAALLLTLGGARLDAGDAAGAEAAWSQALAARPGDPIILNNLADLRGRADPAAGLPLARDAYAAAPREAAVAQTYARLLAGTGDEARARRVLRRALLGAPTDAGLLAALARLEGPGEAPVAGPGDAAGR